MARPKGQHGTVQKLGRTWRYGYWEPQADGTRKRVWQGGYRDEASAGKALRKVLVQLDEGTYVPVSDETVGAYLAEWLESQRAHVEANTRVTDRVTQAEGRRLWPGPIENHGLVFTWENGAQLSRPGSLAASSGWPRRPALPATTRLYDLRHGGATVALRAGVHPKPVQDVIRLPDHGGHLHARHALASAHAVNSVAALLRSLHGPDEGPPLKGPF